jgi:DNA-binding LacI/PurR family transcriptional regulator
VIGFDDIPSAAYSLPRLTTIRQPLAELGRIASRRLLDRIQELDTPTDDILVAPELVVRESSGPAKAIPAIV